MVAVRGGPNQLPRGDCFINTYSIRASTSTTVLSSQLFIIKFQGERGKGDGAITTGMKFVGYLVKTEG
jgi:hypothetical protein